MYSNESLYYLNQLGITPWLLRHLETPKNNSRIFVLCPIHCSLKAEALFKKMMAYMDINLKIILVNEEDFLECSSQLLQESPLALLILGINPSQLLTDFQFNCPIISSFSPDYLLNNPLAKKKVFHDLHRIKTSM